MNKPFTLFKNLNSPWSKGWTVHWGPQARPGTELNVSQVIHWFELFDTYKVDLDTALKLKELAMSDYNEFQVLFDALIETKPTQTQPLPEILL